MEASPWGSGADVILAAVLREFLRLLVHPHRDLPHVLPELIEQNAIQPSPTTTAGGRQSQKLVLHRPYGKPVKFDAPQLHQLQRHWGRRYDCSAACLFVFSTRIPLKERPHHRSSPLRDPSEVSQCVDQLRRSRVQIIPSQTVPGLTARERAPSPRDRPEGLSPSPRRSSRSLSLRPPVPTSAIGRRPARAEGHRAVPVPGWPPWKIRHWT